MANVTISVVTTWEANNRISCDLSSNLRNVDESNLTWVRGDVRVVAGDTLTLIID